MNDDGLFFLVGALFGAIIGSTLVLVATSADVKEIKKQAVENGAATWDTNSSGQSTFRWLNEKKSEK